MGTCILTWKDVIQPMHLIALMDPWIWQIPFVNPVTQELLWIYWGRILWHNRKSFVLLGFRPLDNNPVTQLVILAPFHLLCFIWVLIVLYLSSTVFEVFSHPKSSFPRSLLWLREWFYCSIILTAFLSFWNNSWETEMKTFIWIHEI